MLSLFLLICLELDQGTTQNLVRYNIMKNLQLMEVVFWWQRSQIYTAVLTKFPNYSPGSRFGIRTVFSLGTYLMLW